MRVVKVCMDFYPPAPDLSLLQAECGIDVIQAWGLATRPRRGRDRHRPARSIARTGGGIEFRDNLAG
ncbi:hypothetical protein WS65_27560 [Burkholderia anthina]|nr:hypothetical protein WS65_27560 [Burkholderia anthina]